MTDHSIVLRGRHSAVALAAMRSAPPSFLPKVKLLHQRQQRQGMRSPGGTVRRFSEWITLPCGTDLSLVKQATKEGGDMQLVLGRGVEVTLVGRDLRLLQTKLPDTVIAALIGKPVGTVADMTGCGVMAAVGDAIVKDVRVGDGRQIIILDLPHADITIDDACADHAMTTRDQGARRW